MNFIRIIQKLVALLYLNPRLQQLSDVNRCLQITSILYASKISIESNSHVNNRLLINNFPKFSK